MENQNFTTSISVSQTPEEVFNAINNVRGWWSENINGSTDQLNAEYIYNYQDVHYCKIKLIEFVPGKKVVWLVLDNYFKFTEDKSEWKGTKIIFELSRQNNQTTLVFTHEGLVPQYECFEICREAWTNYIQNSLYSLITAGKGQPNEKDNDSFNAQLTEKWSHSLQ